MAAGSKCCLVVTEAGQLYFWGQIKVRVGNPSCNRRMRSRDLTVLAACKASGEATMYPKPVYDLSGWALDCVASGYKHVAITGTGPCWVALCILLTWLLLRGEQGHHLGTVPVPRRAGRRACVYLLHGVAAQCCCWSQGYGAQKKSSTKPMEVESLDGMRFSRVAAGRPLRHVQSLRWLTGGCHRLCCHGVCGQTRH